MTSGRSMSGRRFFCVLAASALSLISAAQASAETLRVATPYPAVNFHTQNLQAFATAVSSATNGGLKLEVYPNGTLLKPAAIFDGVKDGKAEAGEVMLSTLAQRDPLAALLRLLLVRRFALLRPHRDVAREIGKAERQLAGLDAHLDVGRHLEDDAFEGYRAEHGSPALDFWLARQVLGGWRSSAAIAAARKRSCKPKPSAAELARLPSAASPLS